MSISNHVIIINLLIVNIFIFHVESAYVEFPTQESIRKDVKYSLKIRNSNTREKFPVDNFVIAFELLKSLSPRAEMSIGDVTSDTYTGDEYRGFSIKNFVIKNNVMEMTIEFRREAHGTWFRVRYTSAETEKDKEAFFMKNTDSNIIFEHKIEMLLPYTITIQAGPELREINVIDKEAIGNGLLPGKNGQLQCHATEGLPRPLPMFVYEGKLSGATVNSVNDDITQLVWPVRIEDHGTEIECRAGRDVANVTLSVYHYFTEVKTSPVLGDTLAQGSKIKCTNKDGYPSPRTFWVFVSGPTDAMTYYQLIENDSVLLVNNSAPINSNWSFECSGSSTMPDVVSQYLVGTPPIYPIKRTYNFTIVGIQSLSTSVQTSSTGIVVVVILLILFICIGAVGYRYREKIQKFIQDKRLSAPTRTKEPPKPVDQGYKYSDIKSGNIQRNGTEREERECDYSEIVATVQFKTVNPPAPIEKV